MMVSNKLLSPGHGASQFELTVVAFTRGRTKRIILWRRAALSPAVVIISCRLSRILVDGTTGPPNFVATGENKQKDSVR